MTKQTIFKEQPFNLIKYFSYDEQGNKISRHRNEYQAEQFDLNLDAQPMALAGYESTDGADPRSLQHSEFMGTVTFAKRILKEAALTTKDILLYSTSSPHEAEKNSEKIKEALQYLEGQGEITLDKDLLWQITHKGRK